MGTRNNINQGPKQKSARLARIRKRESKCWKVCDPQFFFFPKSAHVRRSSFSCSSFRALPKVAKYGKQLPEVTMTRELSKKKQKQIERTIKIVRLRTFFIEGVSPSFSPSSLQRPLFSYFCSGATKFSCQRHVDSRSRDER